MKDKNGLCPHCGRLLQEGATFCLYCMEPLEEKEKIEKPPLRFFTKKKLAYLFAALSVVLIGAALAMFAAGLGGESKKTPDEAVAPAESESEPDYDADSDGETDTEEIEATEKVEDTEKTEETTEKDTEGVDADPETEYAAPPVVVTETVIVSSVTEKATENTKRAAVTTAAVTKHVHTDSCYTWIVVVPYQPAIYKEIKVYDTEEEEEDDGWPRWTVFGDQDTTSDETEEPSYHMESVLVSDEVKEVGHYELTCGY